MDVSHIEQEFRKKVCEQVRLVPEGIDRFRIFTPFLFEDGDHLAIVLKKESSRWMLSDEGHTFMHLTYDLDEKDLRGGTRLKVINNALGTFSVHDREGELVSLVEDQQFGNSLYSFVQALLRISDVSYLSRERIRSTFMEDFHEFLVSLLPRDRFEFDWHDPLRDPEEMYKVDCRINGTTENPLFVFALPTDDKVKDATISFLQYERWGIPYRGLGIFENQEDINRKVLARFSDVCDKQFSNLIANKDRIERYIQEFAPLG